MSFAAVQLLLCHLTSCSDLVVAFSAATRSPAFKAAAASASSFCNSRGASCVNRRRLFVISYSSCSALAIAALAPSKSFCRSFSSASFTAFCTNAFACVQHDSSVNSLCARKLHCNCFQWSHMTLSGRETTGQNQTPRRTHRQRNTDTLLQLVSTARRPFSTRRNVAS